MLRRPQGDGSSHLPTGGTGGGLGGNGSGGGVGVGGAGLGGDGLSGIGHFRVMSSEVETSLAATFYVNQRADMLKLRRGERLSSE
jgi:hypothetical protein